MTHGPNELVPIHSNSFGLRKQLRSVANFPASLSRQLCRCPCSDEAQNGVDLNLAQNCHVLFRHAVRQDKVGPLNCKWHAVNRILCRDIRHQKCGSGGCRGIRSWISRDMSKNELFYQRALVKQVVLSSDSNFQIPDRRNKEKVMIASRKFSGSCRALGTSENCDEHNF